eukprot:TRINITY_DN83775_c0_g1_i1.p1 TRINITY_DN83775_c0_g1~~TRINITY_DN83775_c0_g1_i1.p1  ORF type:complete len:311 (+),score=40.84 TRINITY_DN83775_c0_g1_i1:60-992(+)
MLILTPSELCRVTSKRAKVLLCVLGWVLLRPLLLGLTHLMSSHQGDRVAAAQRHAKDRCLILYHIPKSGGTSLYNCLKGHGLRVWTHYAPLYTIEGYRWNNGNVQSDRDTKHFNIRDADVYMDHWTAGDQGFRAWLSKMGIRRNCYEATVLRNPLERVSSALHFHHAAYSWKDHVETMSKGPSLSTFEYFNDMCRMFGSDPLTHWDAYDLRYRQAFSSRCNMDRAKKVLSDLDYVLFTDDFGEVLETLRLLFKPARSVHAAHENVVDNESGNPGFNNLPAKLQQLIQNGNQEDSRLYEWARSAHGHSAGT